MLLDLTTWWHSLPATEQLFWAIGLISNSFFAIYLILQMVGGHDSDFHPEHPDIEPTFAILSLRSIMAFGMFLGYTGVVCTRMGVGWFITTVVGILAGIVAAWLAWRLLLLVLRLQSSGTLDLQNAVGKTGTVHLVVPAQSRGTGKVSVDVQGALRELDAISEDEEIPTGQSVLVMAITDDGLLIVKPF